MALQASESPYTRKHREGLLRCVKEVAVAAREKIKRAAARACGGHTTRINTNMFVPRHTSSSHDHRGRTAAPAPASAISSDDDNDDVPPVPCTDIITFWSSVSSTHSSYALSIESFFSHPQLVEIYQRLLRVEQNWQTDDLSALCDDQRAGPRVGYVYVAKNPFFGPLLKIGATMRTPQIRVRELAGAGVPEPFEVITSIPSTNPFALEREIHAHYAGVRKYGMKKEFFLLDEDDAIAYFHSLAVRAMSMPPRAPRGEPPQTKIKRLRKMYLSAQTRAAKLQAELSAAGARPGL